MPAVEGLDLEVGESTSPPASIHRPEEIAGIAVEQETSQAVEGFGYMGLGAAEDFRFNGRRKGYIRPTKPR